MPTPMTLYGVSIELSLVQYHMLSYILFFESYCSCIIVKTSLQLKLSNTITSSSFDITLRNWMNVKSIKLHWMLFFMLLVESCPLTCLCKIRHQAFYLFIIIKNNKIEQIHKQMGSSPSNAAVQNLVVNQLIIPNNQNKKLNTITSSMIKQQIPKQTKQVPIAHKQKQKYNIPELQKVIIKAHKDLHSRDPIGKKRYFFQVVNFIFQWLKKSMQKGMTLYEAQCLVEQDLKKACKDYPIGKIQNINCNIKDIKPSVLPDLLQGIQDMDKQKFTDRVKQLCLRSKKVSYEFNKQMQLILQKQGGFKFKASYKSTGTKAYMRILTKILQQFFSDQGSKQVYQDMDHYFWTPIFVFFNKIIDSNMKKLNIEVYDWIRCKVFYKSIEDLQNAYNRLNQKHKENIFRVKNRINTHTRDILLNLKYQTQYTQVQLALQYEASTYQFNHKLYQLTRQKLGVAYCCFTILLNQVSEHQASGEGIMTGSGYIKRTLLRQEIEDGFQRLTIQDAYNQWESIHKLLDDWDIVALQSGLVQGSGYQQKISRTHYGPQISQMMIIKRKSADYLENWLNWMQ